MSVIMRTVQVPDLYSYEKEFNKDGTEKHISLDGARFHVVSYAFTDKGMTRRCSCSNCEINKESK